MRSVCIQLHIYIGINTSKFYSIGKAKFYTFLYCATSLSQLHLHIACWCHFIIVLHDKK